MEQEPGALREAIMSHPFSRKLAPQHIELLIQTAMLKEFKAGEVLFREGEPANRFYIIQKGEVLLESAERNSEPVAIQTIGAGDALGWSWLFPPYYWHFDARVLSNTTAILFYGTWLRENCERDHDFGYAMLKQCSNILLERLQASRKRFAAVTRG